MRAKWLWATWAYLAVAGVIVLDLLFIAFAVKTQLPKLHVFTRSGWLQSDDVPTVVWLVSFLHQVEWAWDRAVWWLLIAAAAWGVFEWRVRGDNKSMMRLSAWGTLAFALTVVVILTAGALVLPFVIGLPNSSISRPFAVEQIRSIETSIAELEQAQTRKDWEAMRQRAEAATQAMNRLSSGPALHSLQGPGEPVKELWEHQYSAKESLQSMQAAIRDQNAERLKAALEKFHKSFAPLQASAGHPAQ